MLSVEYSHSSLSAMLEMGYKLWKSSRSTGEYDQVVLHQQLEFKDHPRRSLKRRRVMNKTSSWSDLPTDMLQHITLFLPLLPDQHRFSAVCRNWRIVAKPKLQNPPPLDPLMLPPWLVLGENPTTKKRNFYSLPEKRHYSIDVPELYEQYIFGSSHGWLFIVDKMSKGRLLNPFTREFYDLPCFPPYSEWRYNPFKRPKKEYYEIKDIVSKGILTNDPRERSDFTAVIIFGEYHYHELGIWRQGDPQLTVIKLPDMAPTRLADVICFRGNVYVLCSNYMLYSIVDVGSIPRLRRISGSLINNRKNVAISSCLVDLRGKLLLVIKIENSKAQSTMQYYRVIHCNLEEGLFYEIDHLDGFALFLGVNSALVVDPNNYPGGCIKNCIYFGDMGNTCFKQGHEFGVYNMVDKTVTQLGARDDHDHLFNPPDAKLMWITLNLR